MKNISETDEIKTTKRLRGISAADRKPGEINDMNKMLIIILIGLSSLTAANVVDAAEYYRFGVFMGANERDQQLKPILETVMKYISETEKATVELKWYDDEKEFLAQAEKQELDFGYTKKTDDFIALVDYGYIPFLGISLFGEKQAKTCLYSTVGAKVTNMNSMKGLRLVTYKDRDGYYPLRKIIGDRLNGFFSEVKLSNSGLESLALLSRGEVDLALAVDSNVLSLKIFNPSLMKKINELVCAKPMYPAGIVRNRKTPPALINKIASIMENANKSEVLKPYRNMLKTTKIKFFPITKKEYEDVFKLYSDAEANGWNKDYVKWISAAGK